MRPEVDRNAAIIEDGVGPALECCRNQGAAYLFESLNIKVHPVDVDAQGMDTARLSGIEAQLVHVMPSHQYPIGATLSPARRTELLQWAERNSVYIIEDDYDSEFRYEGLPLPALKPVSPENTIYLGTFSKSLGAGLRMGYCIFPDHLVAAARAAKALLDNGQVWLEQSALVEFIAGGGFARHLRRTRARYLSRRNTIVTALRHHFPRGDICGAEAGTHLALKLPLRFSSAHRLQALARSRNIGAYTVQSGGGHEYNGCAYEDRWLLLGYASLTEEQIEAGVTRLAELVQDAARPNPP